MSELEYKDFDAELELKGDDAGQFSAYFARFGNVDRVNELIEPGAFKNLDEFISDGWVGVNHDMKSLPVAMIDSARQDNHGLLVSGRFHSHAKAQAIRSVIKERMERGKSVKCSIGYKTDESKSDKVDGKPIKRLTAMRVMEASFVNLPANPLAQVVSAKSIEPEQPKLIGIDELKTMLEEFETKAGKVISRANYNKLKDMHAKLSDARETLGKFLDQHDPDGGVDEPDDDSLVGGGGQVVGKAAKVKLWRLRALRSRMKLAALHRE